MTLIGYSSDQQMVYTRLVGEDDVDELITKIFTRHLKLNTCMPEMQKRVVTSARSKDYRIILTGGLLGCVNSVSDKSLTAPPMSNPTVIHPTAPLEAK